jgi:RNA polymerase sigma-70 factor (ECF subfamily)
VRAWKARERYDERRASVRTWLYRIATNACLTAIEGRARRPLPSGLGEPGDNPTAALEPGREVPWLEPFPDPAGVVATRGSLRLAFVAALQHLPARQRAILVLRDVLEHSAAEVATMLGTTATAVNSGLQRARGTLSEAGLREDELREPPAAEQRARVDRYVEAFVAGDIEALTRLLTDDVILEMPPFTNWYQGRSAYGGFMKRVFDLRGIGWRLDPITANGQPGVLAHTPDGALHTLQLFTVTPDGIARTTVFQSSEVFALFRP